MKNLRPGLTVDCLNRWQSGTFAEWLGIRFIELKQGALTAELSVKSGFLAPNGFLHAAIIVALADICCGYACLAHLSEERQSATTIELKANFLGTSRASNIVAVAIAQHLGRRTHVWDATVLKENGDTLALFRCTQLIIDSAERHHIAKD